MIFRCSDPLRIAALVLCGQLLGGCGGGATDTEPAAGIPLDSYTCTYFIDAANGADTNSGTSPETAWSSADRATAHTRSTNARAGDVICFKRGQRFVVSNGQLGISGSATKPVIIGAYGDASKSAPRLSPAIRIDNLPGWVNLGNDIFFWPYSQWVASSLWRGSIWQRPATDQTLRDGDWYHIRGEGIYVRMPSGPSASGSIYLDVRNTVFNVNGLQHIAFVGLTFEYAGAAITGHPVRSDSQPPSSISYLTVQNSRFEHVSTGIFLLSETVDGRAYENHHIDILGNQFNDVRFAVHFGSLNNGPEHHRYVTIARNSIRGIAINGRYTGNEAQDIEAIGIQNPIDLRIMDNRIEEGLRFEQGLINIEGEHLFSVGIALWKHPAIDLQRVRIERNYIRGLGYGMAIGSGPHGGMREITVANNIISICAFGLKVNGTDFYRSFRVHFNTLFRNGTNLYVANGGGQIVVNNFSVEPREYHVMVIGTDTGLTLDHNIYTPDGRFHFHDELQNLSAFQTKWRFDEHSLATANGAGFVSPVLLAPDDFKLTDSSPAHGGGVSIGLGDGDFGRRARPPGGADVGAWARYPSDG